MSVVDMRNIISQVYKGFKWKCKVDKMSDQQVTAIYLSFKRKGVV